MTKLRLLVLTLAFGHPAAAQDAAKVVFVPAAQIESDIRKAPANSIGESEINLIEHTPEHAAILLRRTAPGQAEVHEFETDVWYVIDGGCVFVTGGSVVGGAQTSPGQIRGSSISGGDERRIAKGDFMRIPPGVPHWVKKIEGKEIVYIVVKFAAVK
jgi:mannose-6-phosphate isomerase-like protein (cupin superfamily)